MSIEFCDVPLPSLDPQSWEGCKKAYADLYLRYKGAVTQALLQEMFDYQEGELYRRIVTSVSEIVGEKFGGLNDASENSYYGGKIFTKKYLTHRLIWLYFKGSWPKSEIDHIDHCRRNNHIENLREATCPENMQNKSKYRSNTSGITGVHLTHYGKWQAKIRLQGILRNIGTFPTKELAITARKQAKIEAGFHQNHGLNLSTGETI